MSLDFKLRRSLTGLNYGPALWNPVWLAPAEPKLVAELFEEPLAPEELYSEALDLWNRGGSLSLTDRTLEFYTNFYLPDDILAKVDRAAMMCSLEARAVFLDNDVAEFCRRLPSRFKIRGRKRKFLLKKAMEGILPADIIGRAKKGFGIPAAQWLRAMGEAPLAPVTGMRMNRMARAWDEHRAGRADHRLLLWSWLSLQAYSKAAA
jgi:asparagine synthase (glutamine-hydrolysing)